MFQGNLAYGIVFNQGFCSHHGNSGKVQRNTASSSIAVEGGAEHHARHRLSDNDRFVGAFIVHSGGMCRRRMEETAHHDRHGTWM